LEVGGCVEVFNFEQDVVVLLFPGMEYGGGEVLDDGEVMVFAGVQLVLEAMDDAEDLLAGVGEVAGERFGAAEADEGDDGVGLEVEAEKVGGEGDVMVAQVIG